MKIFLSSFFVILLSEIECRSLISSDLNDASAMGLYGKSKDEFPRGSTVPNLIDDYAKNFTRFNNELVETSDRLQKEDIRRFFANQDSKLEKMFANVAGRTIDFRDYEEQAAQWLGLWTKFFPAMLSKNNDRKIPNAEYNLLEDMIDFLNERNTNGPSNHEIATHINSAWDHPSSLFSSTDENPAGIKEDEGKRSSAGFHKILMAFRSEIDWIRKYFEKLCDKHHSTSSM